jgi:hypothetical protein
LILEGEKTVCFPIFKDDARSSNSRHVSQHRRSPKTQASLIASAALAALLAASAGASISVNGPTDQRERVDLSGNVVKIAAPRSVHPGELVDPSVLKVFAERREHDLNKAVYADITQTGPVRSEGELTPGTISPGTRVTAFMIHGDAGALSIDSASDGVVTGSVTFSSPVLAVIISPPTLTDSDPDVGAPQTDYPSRGEKRGIELDGTDSIELSEDRLTVTFRLDIRRGEDQIRVLVTTDSSSDLQIPTADMIMFGSGASYDAGMTGWLYPTPPATPLRGFNNAAFSGSGGGGGGSSGVPTLPEIITDPTDDPAPAPKPEPEDPTKDPKNPDVKPDKPKVDLPPNKDVDQPPTDPVVPAPASAAPLVLALLATRRRR